MGSIARVRVTYQDLHSFISKYNNVPVYAATLAGKPVHEYGKISKGIILIGNESKGISEHLIKISTYKITIPKNGYAESLNAAVATGIILSHIVKCG
jgi:TrmH family RNA methyltransferase